MNSIHGMHMSQFVDVERDIADSHGENINNAAAVPQADAMKNILHRQAQRQYERDNADFVRHQSYYVENLLRLIFPKQDDTATAAVYTSRSAVRRRDDSDAFWTTLYSFLRDHSLSAKLWQSNFGHLQSYAEASPDYRPDLSDADTLLFDVLSNTIVCIPPDAPDWPSIVDKDEAPAASTGSASVKTLENSMSMTDVIDSIVFALLTSHASGSAAEPRTPLSATGIDLNCHHVLTFGYRLPRSDNDCTRIGPFRIACYMPNTVAEVLKFEPWISLLRLIGDDLMCYLLRHSILLAKIPRNCCLLYLSGNNMSMYIKYGNKLKKEQYGYMKQQDTLHMFHYSYVEERRRWKLYYNRQYIEKSHVDVQDDQALNPDGDEPMLPADGPYNDPYEAVATQDLLQFAYYEEEEEQVELDIPDAHDQDHDAEAYYEDRSDSEVSAKYGRKRKRKPRLSAWRRKKYKKLAASGSQKKYQSESSDVNTHISSDAEDMDDDLDADGSSSDSEGAEVQTAAVARSPKATTIKPRGFFKVPTAKQKKHHKAFVYLPPIIRMMIFYRTYTGKIVNGFEEDHILNRLTCADPSSISTNSIKPLFHYIFNRKKFNYAVELAKQANKGDAATGSRKKHLVAQLPKGDDRISSKKYGLLIDILKNIKSNYLRFGNRIKYMLEHYCPVAKKKSVWPAASRLGQPAVRRNETLGKLLSYEEDSSGLYSSGSYSVIIPNTPEQEKRTFLASAKSPEAVPGSSAGSSGEASSSASTIVMVPNSIDEDIFYPRVPVVEYEQPPWKHEDLLKYYSSYAQVSAFLKSVCSKLLPSDLWGTEHNKYIFHKHLDEFISMGRYEVFTLQNALQGFYLNDVKWLWLQDQEGPKDRHYHVAVYKTFLEMLHFVFSAIVIPLIYINFYCTESNWSRTYVYYFRKDVWTALSSFSWRRLTKQYTGPSTALASSAYSANQVISAASNNSLLVGTSVYKPLTSTQYGEMLERHARAASADAAASSGYALPWDKILHYGKVRLLPKDTKVRPIINMGRKRRVQTARGETLLMSTNTKLENTLRIMKFEHTRRPELLGSSVFNSLDIYRRLLPFVKLWKQQRAEALAAGLEPPRLSIVSVDVRGAYDSIPHEKLMKVVQDDIFREDEYLVLKFHVVRPYLGRIAIKYERHVLYVADYPDFKEFALEWLAYRYSKSIFTDYVNYAFEDKSKVLQLLRYHIEYNVIMYRDVHVKPLHDFRYIPLYDPEDESHQSDSDDDDEEGVPRFSYYHQCKGIPQGSVLSPLLCSYLYADLEKNCLSHLPGCDARSPADQSGSGSRTVPVASPPDDHPASYMLNFEGHPVMQSQMLTPAKPWNYYSSVDSARVTSFLAYNYQEPATALPAIGVLVRLIDDFMYVTTSKPSAVYFLEKMGRGFDEYGVGINRHKTKVNFELPLAQGAENNDWPRPSSVIRWCGFLFDSETLEVKMDYSKYFCVDDEGNALELSIELDGQITRDHKNPGLNLSRKLKQTISWKCNPLVLDGTINSEFTVCLNVYQTFLFVAMKFHCLVYKTYLLVHRTDEVSVQRSHDFLLGVIKDVLEYMWITVCARASLIYSDEMQSSCPLTESACYWLGIQAFSTILYRKYTSYRAMGILQSIQRMMEATDWSQSPYQGTYPLASFGYSYSIVHTMAFNFKRMPRHVRELLQRVTLHEHSRDILEKIRF